jgi:hypothetical protein
MVENTKSTILEVQGSFVLTYMVGIIPPNLRSQETDKGVPHARAPPLPAGPGMVVLIFRLNNRVNLSIASFSRLSLGVQTLLLQLPSARG